jgi:hypothetical protein
LMRSWRVRSWRVSSPQRARHSCCAPRAAVEVIKMKLPGKGQAHPPAPSCDKIQ